MCIFLYLALPAPNRQCRNHQGEHVIERMGELTDSDCGYFVDMDHTLTGPFTTEEACEAALRVAAQVRVAP